MSHTCLHALGTLLLRSVLRHRSSELRSELQAVPTCPFPERLRHAPLDRGHHAYHSASRPSGCTGASHSAVVVCTKNAWAHGPATVRNTDSLTRPLAQAYWYDAAATYAVLDTVWAVTKSVLVQVRALSPCPPCPPSSQCPSDRKARVSLTTHARLLPHTGAPIRVDSTPSTKRAAGRTRGVARFCSAGDNGPRGAGGAVAPLLGAAAG